MGVFRRDVIGTKVKQVLSYNPNRRQAVILNLSSNTIYVSDRQVNIKEEGIPVLPGSALILDLREGDDVYAQYYSVCEVENCEIRIYEAIVAG